MGKEQIMKTTHRNYNSDTDRALMIDLARRFFNENLHVVDLPYRLSSWGLDDPANAHLWFDDQDRLTAWAFLNKPFWTMDYALHPAVQKEILPQVLEWVRARAAAMKAADQGLPCWFMMAFASQPERGSLLEAAGFASQADVGEDSWSKVLMHRPGDLPLKRYQPPSGFTLRPLAGQAEVSAYVELHQTVFGTKNMTTDWRSRTLSHPAYRPDLDIVIETPEHRLGSFCIGWMDADTRYGHVEPLGCHKDFTRYALGRTALCEVLYRLQSAGCNAIYVETDNYRDTAFRLYESVGFRILQDVIVYRKDFE
jgi:ribosomal protein S18 acetylase RimI-like enzyme